MKTDTVVLVVRVSVIDSPQDFKLLQPRLVHNFVVPDDLDANFLVGFHGVSSPDNIGKDTLTSVAKHTVSSVHNFADPDSVVAFRVIPVVRQGGILLSRLGSHLLHASGAAVVISEHVFRKHVNSLSSISDFSAVTSLFKELPWRRIIFSGLCWSWGSLARPLSLLLLFFLSLPSVPVRV